MRALFSRSALIGLAIAFTLSIQGCGGDSSQALLSQARSKLTAGDQKSAAILLKTAIQKDAKNAQARFELAKIQISQRDFASAEKELRRARACSMKFPFHLRVAPMKPHFLLRARMRNSVLSKLTQLARVLTALS